MSFQETWANASVDERAEAPEPGTYDLVLDDAKAFVSKKGEAWVTLSWRVASLRNKGHAWDEILGFRSQKQASVTKATIARLGVDVDNVAGIEDLDTAVKEKLGQMYTGEVKQNGEYRNLYIDGPSQGPPADLTPGDASDDFGSAEAAADGDDDPIPF